MERLAIEGGTPVRKEMLPYGRQWLDEDDIAAVTTTLRSDWLTTGPHVERFEEDFAAFVGAREAVAVSSGTAALHAITYALGVGPGDEVVVPAMTFAATANCVLYQGATPIFADVDPDTLLLDPRSVEERLSPRTRAILAVDYAGQPCDYEALSAVAEHHDLKLAADACHALGGDYRGRPVGTLTSMSAFSLHPVKHITTGEGGVVTTDDTMSATRMRSFRNHGITVDHRERQRRRSWFYEIGDLGYNYRLTDFQCMLGVSQLPKLSGWISRRREIASRYDEALSELPAVEPLAVRSDAAHAYHLYVIRLRLDLLQADREAVFLALRSENIGVNVHYVPVHLHPYYQRRLGTGPGLCPIAEAAYETILSLPIFPRMTDTDADDVIAAVRKVVSRYATS